MSVNNASASDPTLLGRKVVRLIKAREYDEAIKIINSEDV